MGAFGNLVPLVILFLFVGGVAWVGYQVRAQSTIVMRSSEDVEGGH